MFDVILGTMASLLAADKDNRGDGTIDTGPFSKEEYDENAAGSVNYEITMAVRKAHTRLKEGKPEAALALLVSCRNRLPAGAETKTLDSLIMQLRDATVR